MKKGNLIEAENTIFIDRKFFQRKETAKLEKKELSFLSPEQKENSLEFNVYSFVVLCVYLKKNRVVWNKYRELSFFSWEKEMFVNFCC